MNKLYARFCKAVAYGRYRLDDLFTRGPRVQGTLMVILTLAVILLGADAVYFGLFSDANKDVAGIGHKLDGGFWDAVWWSAMHILDPSYIAQDYGATLPVLFISVTTSIVGLLLFGAVIGFVGTAMDRKIEEMAKGSQPVRETGHVLILGWNDRVFGILDLFEEYHKTKRFVILSNLSTAVMQDAMRTERTDIRRVRPILRTGSPTNLTELERIAFREAYSIIVLADTSHGNTMEESDSRTIKTLILLAGNVPMGPTRPKMVAEIVAAKNVEVARIASLHSVSIVCSGEVLSRMIVQASRQPGLSFVYSELFGFEGTEIFIQPCAAAVGRRFGELIFEFPTAILIGTSKFQMRDGKPYFAQHMNPGKDYVVQEGEWLILIAHEAKIMHQARLEAGRETGFLVPQRRPRVRESILILGWNRNLCNIIREYDSFLGAGSEVLIAALHPVEMGQSLLASAFRQPLEHTQVTYVQADSTERTSLDPLLAGGRTICIILADESSGNKDPDVRAIITIVLLHDFMERNPGCRFKQVISELVSAVNMELLRRRSRADAIISPRLISMLLCQISQQLMLERVYADLMNSRANEIYLKPVARYTATPGRCTFADLMGGASEVGEVAIGLKIRALAAEAGAKFGIRLNPAKHEPLELAEDDEVIVISEAEGAEPKGQAPTSTNS